MNTLDIVLLILMIPGIVRGIMHGLTSQLSSIAIILVSCWLGSRLAEMLCSYIAPYVQFSPAVLKVVSLILVIVAIALVFHFASRVLEGVIKIAMLGWLDRVLGFFFAILANILVLGLALMLFDVLNAKFVFVKPGILADSTLYAPIKEIAGAIFPYIKEFIFS